MAKETTIPTEPQPLPFLLKPYTRNVVLINPIDKVLTKFLMLREKLKGEVRSRAVWVKLASSQ